MADVGKTFEEAVMNVLGFGLGSSGTSTTIEPSVRPSTIEKPGSPPWLIMEGSGEVLTGGVWSPSKQDGKITFWRKNPGMKIQWVNIALTGGDGASTPSINTQDRGETSGALAALRDAWTGFVRTVPDLMGPGRTLDPQSIADTRIFFAGAAEYFDARHSDMAATLSHLNQDDKTFRGSASGAFAQRIKVAMVKVADVLPRAKAWADPMDTASKNAYAFQQTLNNEIAEFIKADGGTLLVPHNFIIRQLNSASVRVVNSSGAAKLAWGPTNSGDGWEMNWDHNLTGNGVAGATPTPDVIKVDASQPNMYISLPELGGDLHDVFDPATWLVLDQQIRALWAKKVVAAFPNTVSAAERLGNDLEAAAIALNAPPIANNPHLPKPAEADIGTGGSGGGGGSGINIPPPTIDIDTGGGGGGASGDLGGGGGGDSDLGDLGGGGGDTGDLGGAGGNLGGTGGIGDLGGTTGGVTGLGDDGSRLLSDDGTGDIGVDGLGDGGADTLGDLSGPQLGVLQEAGTLDDVPLSAQQRADLNAAGMPAAAGATLGSLSSAQLSRLQSDGLLDDEPLTEDDLTALEAAGMPASGSASGLGEDSALTGVGTGGLDNGLTGDDLGANLPSTQFPTSVDGVDVSNSGLGGSLSSGNDSAGVPIGDLTQPMSTRLPVSGGGAGISTGGITPYGDGAGVSGLGAGTTALTTNTGSDLASGDSLMPTLSPAGSTTTALESATSAGMPMMPPMGGMGGMGGGAGNEKTRERNTWLTEDEDVWGTDPDCAPAVIGRGDDFESIETVDTPSTPVPSRPSRTEQPRRRQG